MFIIIVSQIIKMLLLMCTGILCFRLNLVDEAANKKLANLLLLVVNPLVIFSSLQTDYRPELIRGLLLTFALAVAAHLIMIPITNLLIKNKGNEKFSVERLCAMYGNCGFIGIPLIQNTIGSEGVFYLTAFLVVFNLFSWTHGVSQMQRHAAGSNTAGFAASLKQLGKNLLTPAIIASVLGLVLFFLQIRLPAMLSDTIDYLANMNTPLAMIIAGISVAQAKIPAILKNPRIYVTCAIKLILMPAIMFLILMIIRPGTTVAFTVLIASACPVASTCTALALKFRQNYGYASELYTFSTICSMVTIPAFVFAAERLL